MNSIRLENTSTKHEPPEGALAQIVDALFLGLHALAREHSDYVWKITEAAESQGFRLSLIDNPDVADALGFHDLGPDGRPYARIFLDPIFDNGGTWLEGSLSVAAVASHEAFEMVLDPPANRWANDADGMLWAYEACDACEADVWNVDIDVTVSLSNFLFPSYFNPFGEAPFDKCGTVAAPFSLAPGGYAIYDDSGNIGQVFGADYPDFKRALKGPRSRTFARGVAVELP